MTLCGMLKAPKLIVIKALFACLDCIGGSIRVNRINYAAKLINCCFRKDKAFSQEHISSDRYNLNDDRHRTVIRPQSPR